MVYGLQKRRVVVTGLGVISPLGQGWRKNWDTLLSGERRFEKYGNYVVGKCPEYAFTAQDQIERSRCIQHALVAAEEAIHDAGNPDLQHCGVAIGSGIGGLEEALHAKKKPSPFLIPRLLINGAAAAVARRFASSGPNLAPAGACAAGAQAIGEAYHSILRNDCQLMLAGGTEACVYELALAGFQSARALGIDSRPFDHQRSGFILAEGAAILVIEDLEHALARNCSSIYAEIVGYGQSCDAFHATAPLPSGKHAAQAMRQAIGIFDEDALFYINAHAAGTPKGDLAEFHAISSVFSPHHHYLISSTKGATGHLLGAAGAIEAVFSSLALYFSRAPHTLNLSLPLSSNNDEYRFIQHTPVPLSSSSSLYALSNSFGFGGVNASLCGNIIMLIYDDLSIVVVSSLW